MIRPTLVRDIDDLRPHPLQVHEDLRRWQVLADHLGVSVDALAREVTS